MQVCQATKFPNFYFQKSKEQLLTLTDTLIHLKMLINSVRLVIDL